MSDEHLPSDDTLDDVDPEEERAAAALSRALDGGSANADLPLAALEMAALLRYSADGGKLSVERRAQIRDELLSSLPKTSAPRARSWSWLGLGVPVACGATLVGALWLATTRESAEESSGASGSVAAVRTASEAEAPLADELARAAQAYRERLISKLESPRLEQVHRVGDHALGNPAASRTDLEHAARVLADLAAAPASGWSSSDTRLVRQDLFCRLAETALRLGQPDAALDWTRQGLELDGPPTPFLARLSALEGQAKAALGDRLGAAQSYMQALKVNEALLDESLDDEQ